MDIRTPRLELSSITDEDRPEDFLSVFNSNPAFVRASEPLGDKSSYDASDVAMYLCQETNRENSTCLAIRARETGTVIGTACFVAPHPDGNYPWLGLLLLDAEWQGRGLGDEASAALERALAEQGWAQLRLGVLKIDPSARVFWERRGYSVIDEAQDRDARPVWVLSKRLS